MGDQLGHEDAASGMRDRTADHPPRRAIVGSLGTIALAGVAGCSGTESIGAGTDARSPNRTVTARRTETPTEQSPTASAAADQLDTAREALDAAFTEIYSVDLVNYAEKVWTPRFEDLGNMDPEVVDRHVRTARSALSEAKTVVDPGSAQAVRTDLLERVASIADHGSTFYHEFALTYEKIVQYEYLIDSETDYERAVAKMGRARELLARWKPLGVALTEDVRRIKQLYEEHEDVRIRVPAFDVGRWNYTTFGVEQYVYLLQPRLVGFEAYAEAVGADLDGLDHLDAGEWQAAQDSFVTAREKIQQAAQQFSEAESRGDSFFERRARIYENRCPLFEDGYLLHLRAANEFVRGNTENAKDLRFEGTTLIRNAFAKYPIGGDETATPTAGSR